MTILLILLVLALVFGVGAVIEGIAWLAILAAVAFVVVVAVGIGLGRRVGQR